MGIDIFAESCRFYEDENEGKAVVILEQNNLDRFEKWKEDNKKWCEELTIDEFISRNLNCLGY